MDRTDEIKEQFEGWFEYSDLGFLDSAADNIAYLLEQNRKLAAELDNERNRTDAAVSDMESLMRNVPSLAVCDFCFHRNNKEHCGEGWNCNNPRWRGPQIIK
jgi:hypothetical protein